MDSKSKTGSFLRGSGRSDNGQPLSEEEYNRKMDRCLSNLLIKTSQGFGVGVLLLLALKRRAWPLAFATGVGFGMGMANCSHEFRGPYYLKTVKSLPADSAVKTAPQTDSGGGGSSSTKAE